MPSLASALPFSPAELAYLHTSLSSIPPLRPDARHLSTDFRPLRAETSILPSVNGSAHVGFSDGREAIVGVKLEVEKTAAASRAPEKDDDAMDVDVEGGAQKKSTKGIAEWVTLTLSLPGLRDDDTSLIFLEEMLREPLVVASAAQTPNQQEKQSPTLLDKLVINSRWHWHIYIDVLLISPNGLASYPLPLLSMATHLALRDTRIPKLKSEGEEDPIADDDWMASTYLYPRGGDAIQAARPPVTLLVVVVGESVIFDPSREELAVADGVVAVSVGSNGARPEDLKMLAVRMIDTPARDTMKGVPQSGEAPEGVDVPGVWKPRLGGIKRSILKTVVQAVFAGGVARDVLTGLDGFLSAEPAASAG